MGNSVIFSFSNEEDMNKFVDHQNEYDNHTLNNDAKIETRYDSYSESYKVEINRDGIDDPATLRGDADLMAGRTEFDD